jgi:predicted nucleic acid-binding Zn ribbon protein
MARIRNILSEMFGKKNIDRAKDNQTTPDLWNSVVENVFSQTNGAAKHLKIISLSNNILTIEVDHTGWVQILQAQKNKILDLIQEDFTETVVEDIEVVLSKPTK